MNELFGGVVYAGIDTDKHRYPIGKIFVIIIVHFSHYLSSHWLRAYVQLTFDVSITYIQCMVF